VEGFANSRYFARDDVFGSDPCKQKSIPGRKRPHPEPQEAWLARIGYSTIFSEAAALASAVLCDGNTEGAAATDTGASSASAPALSPCVSSIVAAFAPIMHKKAVHRHFCDTDHSQISQEELLDMQSKTIQRKCPKLLVELQNDPLGRKGSAFKNIVEAAVSAHDHLHKTACHE